MEFAKGVKVPFPDKIKEEYEIRDGSVTANIDIDNLDGVVMDFVEMIEEPMYIGIHVPLEEKEEIKLRKDDTDPFHERVYYLDNCKKDDMRLIIDTFMEVLINDGLSKFVIASQVNADEMFIHDYKVASFFVEDIDKMKALMERFNIPQSEAIITAMDTFDEEHYGVRSTYENGDGVNIYDLIDALSSAGMYAGEILEC